jgi:hypothetical protein
MADFDIQSAPQITTPPDQASRPVVKDIFRGSQTEPVNTIYQKPSNKQPFSPTTPTNQQTPFSAFDQVKVDPVQPKPPEASQPQQQPAPENFTDEYAEEYSDEYADAFPELFPGMNRPIVEQLVYDWQAPSRPFKQHDKQFFTTIGTIALLISLILFFAGQLIAIAVVIAVAFLSFVMTTIPPQTVNIQITTYGIRLENEIYYWDEMGWFWFKKKYDDEMVYIEISRFPNRLMLLLGKEDKELIRMILSEVLLENEPPPTYFEKAAAWLQEKVPLDIEG